MPTPFEADVEVKEFWRDKKSQQHGNGLYRGAQVFLPACLLDQHPELKEGRGKKFKMLIEQGKDPRKSPWVAKDVVTEADVPWDDWRLAQKLPETEGAAAQPQLSFGCYKCGQQVLSPAEVFKIKGGAIWTTANPANVRPSGSEFYNIPKRGWARQATCRHCGFNIGAWYLSRYETCEDAKVFPCARLLYSRAVGEGRSQKLAVLGDRQVIEEEIRRHRQGTSAAITQLTHEILESLRIEQEKHRAPRHWRKQDDAGADFELNELTQPDLIQAWKPA